MWWKLIARDFEMNSLFDTSPRYSGSYKRDGREVLFNVEASSIDEVWNFLQNAYPRAVISDVEGVQTAQYWPMGCVDVGAVLFRHMSSDAAPFPWTHQEQVTYPTTLDWQPMRRDSLQSYGTPPSE